MPAEIKEDRDQSHAPMPVRCNLAIPNQMLPDGIQFCGGKIKPVRGFLRCDRCWNSFGPVSTPAEMPELKGSI